MKNRAIGLVLGGLLLISAGSCAGDMGGSADTGTGGAGGATVATGGAGGTATGTGGTQAGTGGAGTGGALAGTGGRPGTGGAGGAGAGSGGAPAAGGAGGQAVTTYPACVAIQRTTWCVKLTPTSTLNGTKNGAACATCFGQVESECKIAAAPGDLDTICVQNCNECDSWR